MCPYIQIILPSYGVLAFVGGFAALLFTYLRLDRFQIAFTQLLKIVVVCIIGCVLGSKLMLCADTDSLACGEFFT